MLKKYFTNRRELILFFVVLLWYVVSIQFYKYVGFQNAATYSHFAKLFAVFMLIICFSDIINSKRNGYVSYIAIGMIISFVMSFIFWFASPFYELQTQGSEVGLLYVVVYFALRKWNINTKTVELVMVTLSIIYLMCWLYSLYKMPELIFGFDRDDEYGEITNRGFYRLFIPGNLSPFLCLYFLGRFLEEKNKKCLILTFAMLIVIILHVGRQMIVWTVIPALIMVYMKYRKNLFKILFAATLGCLAFYYIVTEIPAFAAMVELSEDQGENIGDDIRVEATEYFIFDYPHNILTSIFGNGTPARDTELYRIDQRGKSNGYHQTDVGFFAMYCNYGLWGVVSCLLLLWRVIKVKVDSKYEYLKYYIYYSYGVYLMSQGLTSHFFVVMMAYYILEQSSYNKIGFVSPVSRNASDRCTAASNVI